jgi:hypothetical protein
MVPNPIDLGVLNISAESPIAMCVSSSFRGHGLSVPYEIVINALVIEVFRVAQQFVANLVSILGSW